MHDLSVFVGRKYFDRVGNEETADQLNGDPSKVIPYINLT